MKIASTLSRLIDGAVGAPTIIKVREGGLSELFPILGQFNLSFKKMPMFNMASTFLTRRTIDEIADLGIVEKIYVDWPIKIPEIPVGFTVADFIVRSGLFGLGILKANPMERLNRREEWVTTTETRRFLGVEGAKADGITGNGIKIGVVDSDASVRAVNHRQFMGKNVQRYTVRPGFQTDTCGHGTHVATICSGRLYEAMPNFYVEGVAPDSDLIMVKCLLTPLGAGSTSDSIDGINLAFNMGADIVNLSMGSECENPMEDAFIQAVNMLPEGKIVCAASGNENVAKVSSPAVAEKALAVGAIDVRTREKADFSNTGPELDFIMPGVNIFSGISRETLLDVTGGGPEAFSVMSGTSMATPHLTGIIALAIELMRKYDFIPNVETFREIGRKYGEEHHTNERGYGPLTYDMIKRFVTENLT
jgi:hypothetical protein